jgi:2-polyprenyl-3-methyl-5-hydroxy-6-metoxy-1,4-benzoquinol methylase
MSTSDERLALQQTLYNSRNPTRRWLHTSRRDWVVAALQRARAAVPAGVAPTRALEVGPGSGVYLPTLARLFDEVTATDIERGFLDHASTLAATHPNIRTLVDDVSRSRLPSGHFDVVLCSEVIEHIPDSRPALETFRRILKPDGILVLSTPLRRSPLEQTARIAFLPGIVQIVRRVYREPVLEMGHINLLTEPELRAQLAGAGFRILEHHKSGLYLPLVAEFGGRAGQRLLNGLESRIRAGRLGQFLWTQCYLVRPDVPTSARHASASRDPRVS